MNFLRQLLLLILLASFFSTKGLAQISRTDSLLNDLEKLEKDSTKVSRYLDLGLEYLGSDVKKALFYFDEAIKLGEEIEYSPGLAKAHNAKGRAFAQQGQFQDAILSFQEALKLFQETNNKTGEANILSNLGSIYYMLGNSSKALELHFESLKISEELDNKLRIGTSLNNIGTVYLKNRNTFKEALSFFKKSLAVFEGIAEKQGMATASMNIGEVYFIESKYDSSIYYHEIALKLSEGTVDATFPLTQLGEINASLGNFQKAYNYHTQAIELAEKQDAKFELTQSLIGLAKTQKKQRVFENAISTLERARLLAIETEAKNELLDIYQNLAEINALSGNYKAAYESEINSKNVKEEIEKSSTEQMIQQLQFEFELNKKEAEIELLQKDTELKNAAVFNQRLIIFASFSGLFIFILISIYLFRNNLSKQKANQILQEQKEEINAQREKVELALDQLKSTQAQLIQSEKMASLGELTAGIAHEIKNPLNFVKNFSEVSIELLDEMKQELAEGNLLGAKDISEDIKINLEKINQHGRRADSIVQGMLEHSRSSVGDKVDTDINNLVEEFLRLSYHGIQAKNKDFNAIFTTEFDPHLPKVEVVSQDIGRVVLNLINNAFYAVNERSKKGEKSYQPTVSVSTALYSSEVKEGDTGKGKTAVPDSIKITVKDNGLGIPESIREKIFQPFFTTKPTGQGTGLGLSLAYDIVKAHGGVIEVNSEENKGTSFSVILPLA
ncbi:tetratricopeptide repeat protein [Algoriphagus lacus]|uniref:histidine kinase n=1 Tax=Algoriphagus lacus TaxID=2056311 RepID=A0A418PNZ0_9BACT|nr:tetratricopeptide repeat protein [Algoriphagus lacus]RIW13645.1 tetratricopeptide repeat protein [Algoriphagus lacus]